MKRAGLLVLLAFITMAWLAGCGRWMEVAPIRIQGQLRAPKKVYNRLIHRSRSMGYMVEAKMPGRRYFRVRAFLDQQGRKADIRASFFNVQVQSDGTVDVTVHGYHVRRGGALIHRRLCSELNQFLDALAHELHAPKKIHLMAELQTPMKQ